MRILVSGAAGFIGSFVMREAKNRGHEVTGFDSFDETLYPSDLKRLRAAELKESGLEVSHIDALDLTQLQSLPNCDVFINEMAIPGLFSSWSRVSDYMDANVKAFANVLETFSRRAEKPFVVQASTSSVYGEKRRGHQHSLNPISPYGVSKLAAEKLLQAYSREFGYRYSILRYFSVYGDGQRPDMAYAKFIKAALDRKEITIYGDGHQMRTNTHVSDVANATVLAAEKQVNGLVCDISGDETVKLLDAVRQIFSVAGSDLVIGSGASKPGDQKISEGDSSLAKEKLGWAPKVSFETGISEQIKFAKIKAGLA